MLLTTLASYRDFDSGFSPGTTTDVKLDARIITEISATSAMVCKALHRYVQSAQRTINYSPFRGDKYFPLSAIPVASLDSVTLDGVSVIDKCFCDKIGGRVIFYDAIKCKNPGGLSIVYTGGMANDTADFMEKYPDIVREVNKQIKFELARRSTLGMEQITRRDGFSEQLQPNKMIPSLIEVINLYRGGHPVVG